MDVWGKKERGHFQLFGSFNPALHSGQARTIFFPLNTFFSSANRSPGWIKGELVRQVLVIPDSRLCVPLFSPGLLGQGSKLHLPHHKSWARAACWVEGSGALRGLRASPSSHC